MELPAFIDESVASIKDHEGFRSVPYQDTLGIWTFGHGLTYLTEDESELVMRDRILHEYIPKTIALFPSWEILSQDRKVVLVNMCYNMGPSRLSSFKKMRAAIFDGDFNKAADEMLDSRWAFQVGDSEGERAYDLAEIMRGT